MNRPTCRSRPLVVVVAALAVVTLVIGGAGCPHDAELQKLQTLTSERATALILAPAKMRQRLAGHVKARLPGVQGVVANADLDVIAEPPARLNVAVRSFFEQPMQVLATDGDVVTVFDASSGTAQFFSGPVTDRSIARILPIPLAPQAVVEMLLARPPDGARGRLVGVDEKAGTYQVSFDAPDHPPLIVTARSSDDAIVRWQAFRRDGRPLVDASYRGWRERDGVPWPQQLTLTIVDGAEHDHDTVELEALDVTFNGPPVDPAAFRLVPPPGVDVRPL